MKIFRTDPVTGFLFRMEVDEPVGRALLEAQEMVDRLRTENTRLRAALELALNQGGHYPLCPIARPLLSRERKACDCWRKQVEEALSRDE